MNEPYYKIKQGYLNNNEINKERIVKLRRLHNVSCVMMNEMLDDFKSSYNQIAYSSCSSISYTAVNNLCYVLKCDMGYITNKNNEIQVDNIVDTYINPNKAVYKATSNISTYSKAINAISDYCKIPAHVMAGIFIGDIHVSIFVKNKICEAIQEICYANNCDYIFDFVYNPKTYSYIDTKEYQDQTRINAVVQRLYNLSDKQKDSVLSMAEKLIDIFEED